MTEIFLNYLPYYYSEENSIVLHNYPTIIKTLKTLHGVNYKYIKKAEEDYNKSKNSSLRLYKLLSHNLANYPQNVLKLIGKQIYSAKPLVLYVITPLISEQKITNYTKFFQQKQNNIEKYGNKQEYLKVCNELFEILNFVLQRPSDTTIFNGLIIWLSTIFSPELDPNIANVIRTYSDFYYNSTTTLLSEYAEHFTKETNKNIPSTANVVIKKGHLFFKGVKSNSRSRLTEREKTYYLAFNPVLAFVYAQLQEDPNNIPEIKTLQQNCNSLGYIGAFAAKRTLNLLLINDYENVKMLYSNATETKNNEVLRALSIAFPINDETKTVGRDSDYTLDKIVSAFLCTLKYDGYIAKNFKSFPPEVMVCDSELLEIIDIVPSKKLISYCRGTIYDLQTIIVDNTYIELEQKNIIHVKKVLPYNLAQWSNNNINTFLKQNNMLNYGDRNRNIIEIYQKTDILNQLSMEELFQMYKWVTTRQTGNPQIIPLQLRKNKNAIIRKIKTGLNSYYLSKMNKYIKYQPISK